jgi:hypothetical protein
MIRLVLGAPARASAGRRQEGRMIRLVSFSLFALVAFDAAA